MQLSPEKTPVQLTLGGGAGPNQALGAPLFRVFASATIAVDDLVWDWNNNGTIGPSQFTMAYPTQFQIVATGSAPTCMDYTLIATVK